MENMLKEAPTVLLLDVITLWSKKPTKIINNHSNLGQPWGIEFSRSGKWAVADSSNHCVFLYDVGDKLVKKIVPTVLEVNICVPRDLDLMIMIACMLPIVVTTKCRSLTIMVIPCYILIGADLTIN